MKDFIIKVVDFVVLAGVWIAAAAGGLIALNGTLMAVMIGVGVAVAGCFVAGYWIVLSKMCELQAQQALTQKSIDASINSLVTIALENQDEKSRQEGDGQND